MSGFVESEWTRTRTGQFDQKVYSQPEVTLDTVAEPSAGLAAKLAERRQHLRNLGFTFASAPTVGNPYKKVPAGSWWANVSQLGEQVPQGYVQMDRAGSYLKSYTGAESAVRMPSANAVRKFADKVGTTFDMPVEAATPHGPVTGFVRVTNNGPGRWSVSGVNMHEPQNGYVCESVQAVLESRRPMKALPQTRDILARRRMRLAAAGVTVRQLANSSWLSGGYNDNEQQMVLTMNGRAYGYHVGRDTYEAVVNAPSPGAAYNKLVKGKSPHYAVEFHEPCGAYYEASAGHRCRSRHDAPQTLAQRNAVLTRDLERA